MALTNRKTWIGMLASAFSGALLFSSSAAALPIGWSCAGTCGSLGADGVVTTSPASGSYNYVTTSGGVAGVGLGVGSGIASETTGSVATSNLFSVNAGDELDLFFNYVTSDGGIFSDYAWVRLLDAALVPADVLFTARTTNFASADTVPGFNLPPLADGVTLNPASTPIIAGGPSWSPLAGDSGSCFDIGCGYTGWIAMNYIFSAPGSFFLEFGVVNWQDNLFQSGLAFDNITVAGIPIDPQPLSAPGTLAIFGLALFGMVGLRRRRRAS